MVARVVPVVQVDGDLGGIKAAKGLSVELAVEITE